VDEDLTFFAVPFTAFLALVTLAAVTFLIFGLVSFLGAAAFFGLGAAVFLGAAAFFFGAGAATGVGSTFFGREPVALRVYHRKSMLAGGTQHVNDKLDMI
jgi:hypothetical protein